MNLAAAVFAGDIDPPTARRTLSEDPGAQLVKGRTDAEWSFVGTQGPTGCAKQLWRVVWKTFPGDELLPRIMDGLAERIRESGAGVVEKLRRSGGRSFDAANKSAVRLRPDRPRAFDTVAEVFEGGCN